MNTNAHTDTRTGPTTVAYHHHPSLPLPPLPPLPLARHVNTTPQPHHTTPHNTANASKLAEAAVLDLDKHPAYKAAIGDTRPSTDPNAAAGGGDGGGGGGSDGSIGTGADDDSVASSDSSTRTPPASPTKAPPDMKERSGLGLGLGVRVRVRVGVISARLRVRVRARF